MRIKSESMSTGSDNSLNSFKHFTMAHPKLRAIHEQVLCGVREPGGASIFFILGPTGVGKTTLVSGLMRQIICDLQPLLEQDRERLAVVGIEAEAPAYGNYDFKQHFKRSLTALGEILIDYRIDPSQHILHAEKHGKIVVSARTSVPALRLSLEEALKRRRPAAFFIDEAHHLGKVSGGRKFQDHLDVIKSLANMTETTHILVGTYELQLLLNLSDQLSRRSRTFHSERYRVGQPADVRTFQNIIWGFQRRLPFAEQRDLRLHTDYLMERSLGCVGNLRCWFLRAAHAALNAGSKTLTISRLKQHEPPNAEWASLASALLEGEEALRESDREIESLRLRLHQEISVAKTARNKGAQSDTQMATNNKSLPQHKPGERLPRRDPVGKNANVRKTK